MSLSIIIPVFNEEECVLSCLSEVQSVFRNEDYEIILVNDGSTDRTEQLILDEIRKNSSIKYVRHECNKGYGPALRTGFCAAGKSYISFIDADLQYQPEELLSMYKKAVRSGQDFVIGIPQKKYYGFLRAAISRSFNLYLSLLFGLKMKDVNSLKVMKTELLRNINFRYEPVGLESVMGFHLQNCIINERPIEVSRRMFGKSKISHKVILRNLVDSVRIRMDIDSLLKKKKITYRIDT
ncbi:MAG: glycosyltransferase family 2 protein [Nanoarchaeota archaeon]|nr:glycosyltransferase family 2 protein [Nanoarchaeota archaeon]